MKKVPTEVPALTPYFEVHEPEAEKALARFVGFDLSAMETRMSRWIVSQGVGREIATAAGPRFDLRLPEKFADAELGAKVQAIVHELDGPLMNLRSMHGPEGIARRRWRTSLDKLAPILANLLAHARVREQEDGYHWSHFAQRPDGTRGYDETLASTKEIARLAEALAAQVAEARSRLSGAPIEAHRRRKDFQGEVEARLSLAGFSNSEIGDFTEGPQERARPAQIQALQDRVRKRSTKAKAAIQATQAESARVEKAYKAFLRRTRRSSGKARTLSSRRRNKTPGKAFRAFLTSPEFRRLGAPSPPGK